MSGMAGTGNDEVGAEYCSWTLTAEVCLNLTGISQA